MKAALYMMTADELGLDSSKVEPSLSRPPDIGKTLTAEFGKSQSVSLGKYYSNQSPSGQRSPTSPSAWYLGATPTLEEIKTEKAIPDLLRNMHRRTRSDFTGRRKVRRCVHKKDVLSTTQLSSRVACAGTRHSPVYSTRGGMSG